jgi:hypothetical protein
MLHHDLREIVHAGYRKSIGPLDDARRDAIDKDVLCKKELKLRAPPARKDMSMIDREKAELFIRSASLRHDPSKKNAVEVEDENNVARSTQHHQQRPGEHRQHHAAAGHPHHSSARRQRPAPGTRPKERTVQSSFRITQDAWFEDELYPRGTEIRFLDGGVEKGCFRPIFW